eukprot:TRINITY_DN103636_c0_g1_i1.p1 TRINITY_DN103636_c0_g1~~TRINITY_DN103636_c0_g1_i1.p1  ORF type:complete len:434 (-),score=103.49 TRINITY_DN103636_c0_g1_i1:89-1390(-)
MLRGAMVARTLLALIVGCDWALAVTVVKGKIIGVQNENSVEVDAQSGSSLLEAIGAAAVKGEETAVVSSAQTDDSNSLEAEMSALEQRLSRQASLQEVQSIGALSQQLRFAVQNKLDVMQDSLEGAWSSFLACSKQHEADAVVAFQEVDAMASRHAACRVKEFQTKLDLTACEANLSSSTKLLNNSGRAFDVVNEYPRKGFCMHTSNAREYATVREYALHFRDYFKSQSLEWETSRNAHSQMMAQLANATIKCYGEDREKDGKGGQDQDYHDTRRACNILQVDLENAACDRLRRHRSNCQSCSAASGGYFGAGGVKEQAVAASKRADANAKRLAEISCAVEAYSAGGGWKPWSQLVTNCQKTSAKTISRQLSFPDEKAGALSPGCAGQPSQPGSAAFATKYYRGLLKDPEHWHQLRDELLVCKGDCCEGTVGP